MTNLRRKEKFQRPAETRGKFNDGGRFIKKDLNLFIKDKRIGHLEGDTVESGRVDRKRKSKYCFVTLAECKSRKYIAILVPNRTEKNAPLRHYKRLKRFSPEMVKTITFDLGKEFSGYEENFFPKGMDLSSVNIDDLNRNLELINNRPRKCLGYFTQNEIINKAYINCCT